MTEYSSASYHIAYAHFKLWEFSEALHAFTSFVKSTSRNDIRLHDAYVVWETPTTSQKIPTGYCRL